MTVSKEERELLDRALPTQERASFARELVYRQLDDLNGLGDRLTYLADQGAPAEELAELRARCDEIVDALRWNAAEVLQITWEWLNAPLRYAEDVFGPALVLERLGADSEQAGAWRDSLSGAAKDVLARLLRTGA